MSGVFIKLYRDGWKFALSVSPALQREEKERERERGERIKGPSVLSLSYTFKKCWCVLSFALIFFKITRVFISFL